MFMPAPVRRKISAGSDGAQAGRLGDSGAAQPCTGLTGRTGVLCKTPGLRFGLPRHAALPMPVFPLYPPPRLLRCCFVCCGRGQHCPPSAALSRTFALPGYAAARLGRRCRLGDVAYLNRRAAAAALGARAAALSGRGGGGWRRARCVSYNKRFAAEKPGRRGAVMLWQARACCALMPTTFFRQGRCCSEEKEGRLGGDGRDAPVAFFARVVSW